MTTFGIVGGGGIGAAHCIAARKLGWNLSWVVDTDPEVLLRYLNPIITNEWAYISEQAELNEGIITAAEYHLLPYVDLAIVASPNNLHQKHVEAIRGNAKFILVEKPGLIAGGNSPHTDLRFGYKCLHHKPVRDHLEELREQPSLHRITMMHDFPPDHREWKNDDNIIWDLASHVLSMVEWASPYTPGTHEIQISNVVVIAKNNVMFTANNFECHVIYQPDKWYHSIRGINDMFIVKDVMEHHHEILIDDKSYAWPDDVFETQLETIMSNGYPTISASNSSVIDRALRHLNALYSVQVGK